MNHLIRLNKSLLIRKYIQTSTCLLDKRWSSNSDISTKYSSDSPILSLIEETIFNIHEASGLEWSTTIALTAISLRLFALFPLKIYNEYKIAQFINCRSKINQRLDDKVKKFASINVKEIKNYKRLQFYEIRNEIFKQENFKISQIFASFFLELIIWLGVSAAIRNLTLTNSIAQIAMTTEGALWFSNLTVPDQFYMLPLIFATISLFNAHVILIILSITNFQCFQFLFF